MACHALGRSWTTDKSFSYQTSCDVLLLSSDSYLSWLCTELDHQQCPKAQKELVMGCLTTTTYRHRQFWHVAQVLFKREKGPSCERGGHGLVGHVLSYLPLVGLFAHESGFSVQEALNTLIKSKAKNIPSNIGKSINVPTKDQIACIRRKLKLEMIVANPAPLFNVRGTGTEMKSRFVEWHEKFTLRLSFSKVNWYKCGTFLFFPSFL